MSGPKRLTMDKDCSSLGRAAVLCSIPVEQNTGWRPCFFSGGKFLQLSVFYKIVPV